MSIVQLIKQNEVFQSLASLPHEREIRDADFLLRNDGLIVNVEGWFHPPEHIIGEVLYMPSGNGEKKFFGQSYTKATLYPQSYNPVPYNKRGDVLKAFDSSLDQRMTNPYFAKYKQILKKKEFVAHLSGEQALEVMLGNPTSKTGSFFRDLENLRSLVNFPADMRLGLTGAPLLGKISSYHDVDVVFIGSLEQNLTIAKSMKQLAVSEPSRRLFEGGKAWSIRFFNDYQSIMCCFFAYLKPEDAPLRQFSMKVIAEQVVIEGTVIDDTHTIYTPTLLALSEIKVLVGGHQISDLSKDIPIIIYHTAARGDCFCGDRVKASGALVSVNAEGKEFEAICVIERDGVVNLTPPWLGYYG